MKRYSLLLLPLLLAAASLLSLAVTVPVTLKWINNCTGECTFNIYRGSHGQASCVGVKNPVPFVVGISSTTYTDTTPIEGEGPFSYNVAAVNSTGEVSTCAAADVQCTLSSKVCKIGK